MKRVDRRQCERQLADVCVCVCVLSVWCMHTDEDRMGRSRVRFVRELSAPDTGEMNHVVKLIACCAFVRTTKAVGWFCDITTLKTGISRSLGRMKQKTHHRPCLPLNDSSNVQNVYFNWYAAERERALVTDRPDQ